MDYFQFWIFIFEINRNLKILLGAGSKMLGVVFAIYKSFKILKTVIAF